MADATTGHNRAAPQVGFFGDHQRRLRLLTGCTGTLGPVDDTAPLPPPPPPPYGPYGAPAGGPPAVPPRPPLPPLGAPGPGGPGRPTPRGRREAFAAAVIGSSLLVGAGAGVGGAAAYTHWHDTGPTQAAGGAVATQVVDTPRTPAAAGSVQAVAAKVLPSVVEIDVSGSQGAGSGSGIILNSTGRILTNNHVVEVAGTSGTINVSFNDGSHAAATVVGTDPLTDTALIQATDVSGLTPATIGTSGSLAVGQSVVAIGSPFGLESTVTSGIVSALNRAVDVGSDSSGKTTTYPAIQTDAAINPGNSGGALANLEGDVVGINASIRTADGTTEDQSGSIGLGFAIPMDEVIPIVDQMAAGQTPTHAQLGIRVGTAGQTDGDGNPFLGGESAGAVVEGAQIADVDSGSSAADAGLQKDDVITKVDDHLIVSADSLVATVRSYRPGDQVTLTYVRGGQTRTTQLTLDSDGGSAS